MISKLPHETYTAYRERLFRWADEQHQVSAAEHESPGALERIERHLTAMDKRMVRIETRATNALRYLGLRPGEPVPDAGKGSVAMVDGILMVTGMDVAVRDIALAAVMSNEKGDIPIFVNNHQWGVIHVR